ncbi:hypothetical protein ACG33_13430 [Steroidobacter denitrificans]|uniref:Uncharacterized protein n=1 Tax=Steroidobacter denitrificans TaxID=465721 RepID=A0A127FCE0_STEDE|nr:hypothetical protein [Steroidobacter denitrificans]AMN48084.1 hypothetical protein ACG33_13430 [Steroidobacter denitrificans]
MTYREQLQQFFARYSRETGRTGPIDPHDVAGWAITNRLWEPRPRDVINQLADDISKALREEYRTDEHGRRYRAKHAVNGGPQQGTLWADIDTAPHAHMERAFAQRRQQVVGDCLQLKTDVDVYNDKRSDEEPINMVLDFTNDVAELQLQVPYRKVG